MNVTPTGGTNAANLALFMVNVASQLQADGRQHDPAYSVLDLKADCRGLQIRGRDDKNASGKT